MGKMMKYVVRDADGEFFVEAANMASARRKAAEQIVCSWEGQRNRTVYVHVRVISPSGEYIDVAVDVPPVAPTCTVRKRHQWEYLGVTGSPSGGGVVTTHRCKGCHLREYEDTSATDPVDGRARPHRRYEEPEYIEVEVFGRF